MTDERIQKALELAIQYGQIDGADHKAWVIDQMVRALAGDRYNELIAEAKDGEDGPETYGWDCGIAPQRALKERNMDIVERLREIRGRPFKEADRVYASQAANEIERMRGALRRISNGGTSVLISAALDECPINPDVLEQIVKDAVAGLNES